MSGFRQLGLLSCDEMVESLDLLDEPRDVSEFSSERYSPGKNKNLGDFVRRNRTSDAAGVDSPLPKDLVAGKNTRAYYAHTYHTKVPPQAIVRLIEHYTDPQQLVLDPFAGSGMTGLAALRVKRKPVLIDLSPAATFIGLNFLTPVEEGDYERAFRRVLGATREEQLELYGTHCRTCGKLVPMNYMVWSYGLICEHCGEEFVLWDVARDVRESVRESKIRSKFDCPFCGKVLNKRYLERGKVSPVQVGYNCCDSGPRETNAVPDDFDRGILERIEKSGVPEELWYPKVKLPPGDNTDQPIHHGLDSIDALYTTRQLWAVARLWDIARRWPDEAISRKLVYTTTSLYKRVTRLSEFRFWGGSSNTANYNVPMIFNEQNVFQVFERKAKAIQRYLKTWDSRPEVPFCISTQSATDLSAIPDESIDYIFTDPPFGGNINYSEMNLLWESWLGVYTDATEEAIINRTQEKTVAEYEALLAQAFGEAHRVLKRDRWMTIMFHNSSAQVWEAIQCALANSGFEVESTQTLDKRHGTFKQFVSENAVGYNLLLHCRPKGSRGRDSVHHGIASSESIREFVARHVKESPDEYIVRYAHVQRSDEVDIRKLYSHWLRDRIEIQEAVDVGYAKFRRIASGVLENGGDNGPNGVEA